MELNKDQTILKRHQCFFGCENACIKYFIITNISSNIILYWNDWCECAICKDEALGKCFVSVYYFLYRSHLNVYSSEFYTLVNHNYDTLRHNYETKNGN